DGSAITVTADHPFWVDGGPGRHGPRWLPAGQLRRGDHVRTASGTDVRVIGLRYNVGHAVVYTLTVAHDHTFFVGHARILVHNGTCSTVVKDLIAKASTLAPGMVVSAPRVAQGAGFILDISYKGKTFVARVMVSGGGRSYYW